MAVFTAYFDASGKPDQPDALFVSGAVSSVDRWLEFEGRWGALMGENGFLLPFHMADFKAGVGQYAKWKGDRISQHHFERAMLAVIRDCVSHSFAQGIVVADFNRIFDHFDVPATHVWSGAINKPLSHCGVAVVMETEKWAKKARKKGLVDGPIKYVFDRGDEHRGELASTLRKEFDIEPSFEDKKVYVPIQAADVLAWYHRRAVNAHIGHKKTNVVAPLAWVMNQMPGARSWYFSRWPQLRHYCKKKGFPRRKPTPTDTQG